MYDLPTFLIFACIAVLGWKIFARLKVPAAPVLGGMTFVIVANLLKLPMLLPAWVRLIMSVSLGISIGSRFNLVISRNLIKAVGLFIAAVIAGSLCIGLVVGLMGLERDTAMFASLLGGLTEMAFLAQEFNFDSFQVALFQSVRMCLLLLVIPFISKHMPETNCAVTEKVRCEQTTTKDWIFIAIVSLALGWSLGKLHVPAGKMLGGMICTGIYSKAKNIRPKLNATWHGTMLSFISGSTGLSVTAASLMNIPKQILPMTVYLCMIAFVIWIVYVMLRKVAGLDKRTALFSATMGGLSPSIAMAESMGADSTIVSTFQVVRYFTVIILALVLGYML